LSDKMALQSGDPAGIRAPGWSVDGARVASLRGGLRGVAADQTTKPQFTIDACTTADAWTHAAALSLWDHEYEQVRPGRFSGRVHTAWLGPMQLIHEYVDHAFKYRGTSWRGSRVFFSYLPGCGDVFYDNRQVGTSALVTHRWNGVERVNSSDRIKLVVVAIEEEFLAEYLEPLPGLSELVRTPVPVCFASDRGSVAAFRRSVHGTLQELMQSPALLESERVRACLQQRVLDSIVAVLSNACAPAGRLPAPSTRAYIVGRAIDYMDAHLADSISIRDICASIRISPRTLSYAFSEILGASPKSYLLATRLNRASRDLGDARVHDSIESIAARWGFTHMGRFAQYYRAAFGERPSDTYRARAMRARSAGRSLALAS